MHVIRGTIRSRLLVNAVVDPDEAAPRLPEGIRPHVADQGTVIGCCLLAIEAIRPEGIPPLAGQRLRVAAHRISVEWDDEFGATVTGVYVPVRHTDSRAAVAIGGRLFPGVHERARVKVSVSVDSLCWRSDPHDASGLGIRVDVSYLSGMPPGATSEPVGATCLAASVGVSPNHRGRLEAARMDLSHHDAREVVVEELESGFLDTFATAESATSYLMSDAEVTWERAAAPTSSTGVAA